MKVLILGATGMLGHKLYQELGRSFGIYGTVRGGASELEIYGFFSSSKIIGGVNAGDIESVHRALEIAKPDIVINAIGVVKQIVAENDAALDEINTSFPQKLADLTREQGARLIAISTDCVFSGKKGNYSESDVPDATDGYGTSKRLGEPTGSNVLTLRTSIIGRELQTHHGLVEWFLSNRGKTVKGYVNAIFSGFTTRALANVLGRVISRHKDLSGLYHVSADPISKYDLLVALDQAFATGTTIEPSNDLVIDRSLDSSAFRAATGWEPPTWDAMISGLAADPTPYDRWRD